MPYWLETDDFHDRPVWEVLAGGAADLVDQLQAAYARMKSKASHLRSDGYLTEGAALAVCRGRRRILDSLCTSVLDEKPLVHRQGDECDCLGENWIPGYVYRIHAFLKRNPSRKEYDRNRRQKAELRDARLKAIVYNRDGGCCRYCTSGPLSPKAGRSRDPRKRLHYDHVDPDQPAGPDADNFVVSCGRCNEYKGRRTPDEADMVLIAAPTDMQSDLLLQREQQLHDEAPSPPYPPPSDHRPITDESATDQQPSAADQQQNQKHVADPVADRITDPQPDPIADPTPPVSLAAARSATDVLPDQRAEGSGLGRVGNPDLIHPQPARPPDYPDIYTRRSRPPPRPDPKGPH